ncbi:hypothetical protein HFO93_13565 [Rhizobium leguminosarum]|nr:hypothetical protein [Rhizobium leguminosarum]NKK68500.1 hypothetical protein [Rhizobium leguminosarum bv. viciae]
MIGKLDGYGPPPERCRQMTGRGRFRAWGVM